MKTSRLFFPARLRTLLWIGLLLLAPLAQAQVTVNSVTLPTNIGRGQTVDYVITWSHSGTTGATLTTPLASNVVYVGSAQACSVTASTVSCDVATGNIGDTGTVTFQIQGSVLGGFNLTTTSSTGGQASASSNVTAGGDLTVAKVKTSPSGSPTTGQTTVFTLTPNLANADDVPSGASITVTDNLPGTSTDFALSNVATSGLTPSCTATATANSTRVLLCTYSGPFTVAQLNASTITLTGTPGNIGSFTNVATIASADSNYYDTNPNNDVTNLNYTVISGGDLQAQGSFPSGSVLVSTSQILVLTYKNNGPVNAGASGTIQTTIPASFTLGVLPSGCVSSGSGPWTITCTAGAVASGGNQVFSIPLTMPATATSGSFPVSITVPGGFNDYNLANNSTTVSYNVVTPSADLRGGKSKSPGGPQIDGTTVTSTLTITNLASSPSPATYSPSNPLYIVDYMLPQEASTSTISNVSANWLCVLTTGVSPPAAVNPGRTTQVACNTTNSGTLNAGNSLSVSFQTVIDSGGVTPVALQNTACTGSTALTALGVSAANAAQPSDNNTANDCASDSANLVATPVVSGQAKAWVTKQVSVDNNAFSGAATLTSDLNTVYWRMTVQTDTTANNPNQQPIPTLVLTDNLPAELNVNTTGSPAPSYHTPALTVTTQVTAGSATGSCPPTVANGQLSCSFTNVAPGTVIQIDVQEQRPMASGTFANTATATSPDAILTASASGSLSASANITVNPRVDPAMTTLSMTPTSPRIGQVVQFTMTAQNLGPDTVAAGDFVMTTNLNPTANNVSAAYQILSATGSNMNCTVTAATGDISCANTSTVARYSVRTITVSALVLKPPILNGSGTQFASQNFAATVTVPSASYCEYKTETVTNANVSAACNDAASTSNNSRSLVFDVLVPAIDMKQRKSRILPNGQTNFALGDQLHYLFRVQANGPSRANTVVMHDEVTAPNGYSITLVGGATNINGAAAESSYSLDTTKTNVVCTQAGANATVDCLLDGVVANNYLDANKEVNFELYFTLTPITATSPFSIGDKAYVCADETIAYETSGACSDVPATAGNNLASINETVFPKTDFVLISKTTVTPSPASINQPIQFQIVARNDGPSTAIKIRLVDTLPTGFEWVNAGASVPTDSAAGASTLSGALTVSASVPSNGTDNVCYVSNGITTVTNVTQQQQITCDIGGSFPPGAANTVTLNLYARAKEGVYDGSANAPYLSNRTNTVSILPGKDSTGTDISLDPGGANNTATSTVQIQQARIGGRSFVDLNNNGDQNGTIIGQDQGLAANTVTLTGTDLYGYTISRTTTTDSSAPAPGSVRGDYLFANLPPSSPAGYTITLTQSGPYANAQPQPNIARTVRNGVSSGVSGTYVLTYPSGSAIASIGGVVMAGSANGVQFDFPTVQKPYVSGYVYLDANDNGVKDAGEAGINGVTMTLIGCAVGSNGVVDTASIGAGPASCSGDDVAASQTTTTYTDPSYGAGYYRFVLDQPGRYTVLEQAAQPVIAGAPTLAGMTTGGSVDKRSSPAGSNDAGTRGTVNATGSVGGGAAGVLQEITGAVSRSQIRDIVVNDSVGISVNNNFGELYGARISGFVYTEKGAANSNYQIGADWPLPGATLTLTGTNDAGQAINQSLVSDSNGSYSFAGLRPGTYQVARSNPAGITDEVGGAYPGTDASLAVHGVRVTDDLINAITVGSNTIISNTNFAVVNGPAPAPVPTLSEWAKVMLAALLVVSVGFLQVRSRHCGRW